MDYFVGNPDTFLTLHNSYGAPEQMPVSVFFREEEDLTPLEKRALNCCKGTVLDIGAGVGAITRILQQNHYAVALELSEDACRIAHLLGVKNIVHGDIRTYNEGRFDTLFMLMNGIGLAGKVSELEGFFNLLKKRINPGGRIVLDSSDLSYLYAELESNSSLGEISYQYEYQGRKSPWFNWLYVDQLTLQKYARRAGFETQIIYEDENDQYLAILEAMESASI